MRIANSECYLFADDVKIFKSIIESNSPLLLSSDLSSLNDWCDIWKLKLNERKCAHLCFSFSTELRLMQEGLSLLDAFFFVLGRFSHSRRSVRKRKA